jgi:hypothetical protein
VANVFEYPDITILATRMDHSQATCNAAMDNGSESVVDCSVHVDRGMMKNQHRLKKKGYFETTKHHLKMLVSITDRDIFEAGCAAVLQE